MLCMDVEGKPTLLKTREAQIARQPDNWQRVTCYINFQGEATIARKAEWPGWRPTPDMIARDPDRYGPLKEGLPGGTGNPLGPRALYLYRDNRDTYYRLHGTVEPWTIGTKVSSGCIRLLNQDIMDLYNRVPVGTKAVVLPSMAVATS